MLPMLLNMLNNRIFERHMDSARQMCQQGIPKRGVRVADLRQWRQAQQAEVWELCLPSLEEIWRGLLPVLFHARLFQSFMAITSALCDDRHATDIGSHHSSSPKQASPLLFPSISPAGPHTPSGLPTGLLPPSASASQPSMSVLQLRGLLAGVPVESLLGVAATMLPQTSSSAVSAERVEPCTGPSAPMDLDGPASPPGAGPSTDTNQTDATIPDFFLRTLQWAALPLLRQAALLQAALFHVEERGGSRNVRAPLSDTASRLNDEIDSDAGGFYDYGQVQREFSLLVEQLGLNNTSEPAVAWLRACLEQPSSTTKSMWRHWSLGVRGAAAVCSTRQVWQVHAALRSLIPRPLGLVCAQRPRATPYDHSPLDPTTYSIPVLVHAVP